MRYFLREMPTEFFTAKEGSATSGNYNHAGNPGHVGGSSGSAVARSASVPNEYDYGTKIGGFNLRASKAADLTNSLKGAGFRTYSIQSGKGNMDVRIHKSDLGKATAFLKAKNYRAYTHFSNVHSKMGKESMTNPPSTVQISESEQADATKKAEELAAKAKLEAYCDSVTPYTNTSMPPEVRDIWQKSFLDSWKQNAGLDTEARKLQATEDADSAVEDAGWVNFGDSWRNIDEVGAQAGDNQANNTSQSASQPPPDEATSRIFSESFSVMSPRIDKESKTVNGVVLFAPKLKGENFVSESGNIYSPKFVNEGWKSVEGALSFDGHPEVDAAGRNKDRKPSDALARIRNVRMEAGKWVGDYHIFSHRAESVMSLVEEGWDTLGLSICGMTIGRKDATGKYVAEGFAGSKRRPTVDLVDCSGATVNVFESLPSTQTPDNKESAMNEGIEAAQKQLNELNAQIAKTNRDLLVARKISESKLDEKYVTVALRESLAVCAADRMDAIIKDHKDMVASMQKVVTESGADAGEALEVSITERGLGETYRQLRDGKSGSEGDSRAVARFNAEILPTIQQVSGKRDDKKVEKLAQICETFSVRDFFEAVTGTRAVEGQVREAALASPGFATVTTALLASKAIEGYNTVDGLVGDFLVQPYNSKLKTEKFAGFTFPDGIADVAEGAVYPDATMTDKFVGDAAFSKRGVLVRITEEAILFDQTGQILQRANMVGEALRVDREKMILGSIADEATQLVYYPSGVNAALYGGTNSIANTLTDFTDLQNASIKLAAQVTETSEPIVNLDLAPRVLLVPKALEWTAWRIINSTMVQLRTPTTTSDFVQQTPNPFAGGVIYSSAILDTLTSGTTRWYYSGAMGFKKQFIEKIHIPFQATQVPPAEVNTISADTIGGIRVRRKSKVFALDTVYVIRNT